MPPSFWCSTTQYSNIVNPHFQSHHCQQTPISNCRGRSLTASRACYDISGNDPAGDRRSPLRIHDGHSMAGETVRKLWIRFVIAPLHIDYLSILELELAFWP